MEEGWVMRAEISRRWLAGVFGFVVLGCFSAVFAAEGSDHPGAVECEQVKAGAPIQFKGRTLLETPDIAEPELRRANALLSARCFDQAIEIWEDFGRRNPDNYHVLFLRARFKWIFGDRPMSQLTVEAALRAHPDFASAKVLLASMHIEDQDFPAAAKLLDDVERLQPDDLWGYIDRLRIEAAVAPTPSTADTVTAIMHDPQFPPSVHAQALHIVQFELSGFTQSQRDRALSSVVEDRSVMTDCALSAEAQELIELRDDPRSGAQLIQRYLGKSRPCDDDSPTRVRMFLAEAYLLQAAAVSPEPGTANAALIGKAKEALGGNLSPVALHVASVRKFERLIPFIRGFVDPNAVDDYGSSALCAAVRAYNPPMVAEALREHADPNGKCAGSGADTVLRSILLTATPPGQHVTERQDMVRELLSRGARVEGMADSCKPGSGGDCATVILPILKEFEARRASSRTSL
jgi:tetratricopeptide (TPR) repeat protein